MKPLESSFNLNYTLVNDSQNYEMKTLEDLQWFLLRCIDAKYEDGGPNRCLRLKWTCIKVGEKDVHRISRFLRSRLAGRFKIEVTVYKRDSEGLKEVRFINPTTQCEECEERIDCLTAERL